MCSCTGEQGKPQANENTNMKAEENGVCHSCKWSWVLVQGLCVCTAWDTGEITHATNSDRAFLWQRLVHVGCAVRHKHISILLANAQTSRY